MNDTQSQTWINATQFEAVKKSLISGSLQWPFLFPNPSGTHSSVNMAKHLTKFFTLQVAPFNARARQVLLWKNVLWFYGSKGGHIKWNPLPWHGTQTLGDNSLLRIFSSFLMPTALTSANNLKRFCFFVWQWSLRWSLTSTDDLLFFPLISSPVLYQFMPTCKF